MFDIKPAIRATLNTALILWMAVSASSSATASVELVADFIQRHAYLMTYTSVDEYHLTVTGGTGELTIAPLYMPENAPTSVSGELIIITPVTPGLARFLVNDSSTPPQELLLEIEVAPPREPPQTPDTLTISGEESAAVLIGGVSNDGGGTITSYGQYELSDQLTVRGSIVPDPGDIGREGELLAIALVDDIAYMRNGPHWTPWNRELTTLTAMNEPRALIETETLDIVSNLTGIAGEFAIFFGYRLEDDLIYSSTPITFTVTP